MEFSAAVAVGVACLRLLLQYGGAASEGEQVGGCLSRWGAAALRGFGCPEFPVIPSCWAKCPGMLPSSCGVPVPLRLSKSIRFSLSQVRRLRKTGHRSYCRFPSFQHPTHALCVCALVRMAGAGCLAVLGSLSLPQGEGAGVRGTRVPPGCSLYLTPFARRWVLACVDVVWLLSCVFWSLF